MPELCQTHADITAEGRRIFHDEAVNVAMERLAAGGKPDRVEIDFATLDGLTPDTKGGKDLRTLSELLGMCEAAGGCALRAGGVCPAADGFAAYQQGLSAA